MQRFKLLNPKFKSISFHFPFCFINKLNLNISLPLSSIIDFKIHLIRLKLWTLSLNPRYHLIMKAHDSAHFNMVNNYWNPFDVAKFSFSFLFFSLYAVLSSSIHFFFIIIMEEWIHCTFRLEKISSQLTLCSAAKLFLCEN